MRPNILLVVLDSVRAANVGALGYDRNNTPFLSDFSNESVVYREARAPSAKSISSHTSIFTGLHPEEHGVTNPDHTLKPGLTIWESLAYDNGYRTAVFSSNGFLTAADVGLKRSFETHQDGRENRLPCPSGIDPNEYTNEIGEPQYSEFLQEVLKQGPILKSFLNGVGLAGNARGLPLPDLLQPNNVTAHNYVELFNEWRDDVDGPWAACINAMDAHQPYRPLPEFNRWSNTTYQEVAAEFPIDQPLWRRQEGKGIRRANRLLLDIYDGAILQVDDALSKLVTSLKDSSEYENTLLVITADHGEGFREAHPLREAPSGGHGVHGGLHEALLHVPLFLKPVGNFEPKYIDKLAETRHFPRVISKAVAGEDHAMDFVSDSPVFSSVAPIHHYAKERMEKKSIDYEELEKIGRAIYEQDDDQLIKHIQWGDQYQSYIIAENGREAISRDTPERINDAVSSLQQLDARADDTAPTGAAKQRLEDLGYI